VPVLAQNEVGEVSPKKPVIGASGGFGFEYLELATKETIEIGIHGGVIINHWLSSGIFFNGIFTLNPLEDKRTTLDANILCGYGGLYVAPIIFPNALLHVSVPVFAGYGNMNYELYDAVELMNYIESNSRFWIVKPGIEVEMNVLSFVRVAVGGYYNYTSKIRLDYADHTDMEPILPENLLKGFSVGLRLRFGKF
jgi:hypothetical protein